MFAKANLIYEDAEHHNAVFVGMDENGIPRHAHQKSTNSLGDNFRINTEGSDPAYSFHFISKNFNPQTLFVSEAPIDMLSFISLNQKDWQNASYVALNGVSGKAIVKLLEVYPQLNHVVLCLNHDAAAKEYRQMGHCRNMGTVQYRLSCGFKTYQNRGNLSSRMDEIQQSIAAVFGKQGVITQTEKLELAESYESLAGHCLKAVITMEIGQQKLEQAQVKALEMAMTM